MDSWKADRRLPKENDEDWINDHDIDVGAFCVSRWCVLRKRKKIHNGGKKFGWWWLWGTQFRDDKGLRGVQTNMLQLRHVFHFSLLVSVVFYVLVKLLCCQWRGWRWERNEFTMLFSLCVFFVSFVSFCML